MNIAHYVKAKSLEEAWQLNQKRSAVILGGGCWLRMSPRRRVATAIDLMDLGLDEIRETEEAFYIGAMVPLRQLEISESLETYTQGAMKEALHHIVGTQFRNMATVGGSIWGRFGFSDVLTLFLALDAEADLYKGGRIPLSLFAEKTADTDILKGIYLPKKKRRTAYASLRLNATDFPVLACAVSRTADSVSCSVGARPMRAQVRCLPAGTGMTGEEAERAAREVADSLSFEDNMRASRIYRHDMAMVLCRRLLLQTAGEGD